MELLRYTLRRLIGGVFLLLGVTLVSFALIVYFGPDQTYTLLGKNPTPEQIRKVRHLLGYDQPFAVRYLRFLGEVATFDFGRSHSTGQPVSELLAQKAPISAALVAPGFVLGNLMALVLALTAACHRSGWLDRLIMGASVVGMSISLVIVIIGFQILLCSPHGLNLFPVRGWNVHDLASYVHYVTVPTLSLMFVSLGYNTRFYRAVLVDALNRDHVRTARAFGLPTWKILSKGVVKNSLVPIITQVIFSLPLIVISGSLVIESFFNIPGLGYATYAAMQNGDQPVIKAVVTLTGLGFVLALLVADILYKLVDPRIELR